MLNLSILVLRLLQMHCAPFAASLERQHQLQVISYYAAVRRGLQYFKKNPSLLEALLLTPAWTSK